MIEGNVIFFARPSLRRAYLFAIFYAVVLSYGRYTVEFNPVLEPMWFGLLTTLLMLLVYANIVRATTSYVITDNAIQSASGILARRSSIVPYRRVTNVAARQSFLERLLGLVTLYIDSAGSDVQEVSFRRMTTSEAREAGKIIRNIINSQSAPSAQVAAAG